MKGGKKKNGVERLLNRAIQLQRHSKDEEALQTLHEVLAKDEDHPSAHILAAGLCWKLKRFRSAIEFGRRSVSLAPRSELASLILFASFLNFGDRLSAMNELRRFVLLKRSAVYGQFVQDLADQEEDEDRKRLLSTLSRKISGSLRILV